MGHVINPIAHRLGNEKTWLTAWFTENPTYKVFLQEDFLLYRLLKSFFMQYGLPVFEEKEVRNPKSTPKVAVSGKDNIIPSPFVESSFALSHIKINRGYDLIIECHFMDSLLENWRRNVVRQPNLTSSRIFKPIPKRTFLPYFLTQLRSTTKLQTLFTQWEKFRNFAIKKRLQRWRSKTTGGRRISRDFWRKYPRISQYTREKNPKTLKYRPRYYKISSKTYNARRKLLAQRSKVKTKVITPFSGKNTLSSAKKVPQLSEILGGKKPSELSAGKNAIVTKVIQKVQTAVKKLSLGLGKKASTLVPKSQRIIAKKSVSTRKRIQPVSGMISVSLGKKQQPKILKKGAKNLTPKKSLKTVSKKKIIIRNKKRIVLKRYSTYDNKKVLKVFRRHTLSTIRKKLRSFLMGKKIKLYSASITRVVDNKQRVIYLRNKVKTLAKRAKKRYLFLFKKKKFAKAHPEMATPFTNFTRKQKTVRRRNKIRSRIRRVTRRYNKRLLAKAKRKKWRYRPRMQDNKKLKIFPLSLFQLIFQSPRKLFLAPAKRTFKLLKILLLMFPVIIKTAIKKQIFFITTLRQCLISLFTLPFFVPKMFLIRTITLLSMKENSYKYTSSQYFKKIISSRFLIFQGAHSAIISAIKSFDKNARIMVSFFGMHMGNLSAALTCNYIIYKLGQYFSIQEIFRNLLRDLRRAPKLSGFRIVVAGRLTRKERAAYLIRQKGRLDLSAKASLIDYASDFKIMRFGVVGVKVWLNQREFCPTYYVFKFITNLSKISSKNLWSTKVSKKTDTTANIEKVNLKFAAVIPSSKHSILVKRMSTNQLSRIEKRFMRLSSVTRPVRDVMYRNKREFVTWNVGLRTHPPQKGKAPEMVRDPVTNYEIMNPVDYSGKNHYLVYDLDYKSDEFHLVYGSYTTKSTPYKGQVPVKVSGYTLEGEPKDQYMFVYEAPRLIEKAHIRFDELGTMGISHTEYQEALKKIKTHPQQQ